MTEIDWQTTTTGAYDMQRYIRAKASSRKLQLLLCAACRLVLDHLPADRIRPILAGVELYAEGLATLDEFRDVQSAAQLLSQDAIGESDQQTPRAAALRALRAVVSNPLDDALHRIIVWVESAAAREAGGGLARAARGRRHAELCHLFREVFGNPFVSRRVVPSWMQPADRSSPGWLIRVSETAKGLAAGIQRDQAFDRFPLLADALEEEGCTDDELLLHLRIPAPHVRGCWALDLVLGKS